MLCSGCVASPTPPVSVRPSLVDPSRATLALSAPLCFPSLAPASSPPLRVCVPSAQQRRQRLSSYRRPHAHTPPFAPSRSTALGLSPLSVGRSVPAEWNPSPPFAAGVISVFEGSFRASLNCCNTRLPRRQGCRLQHARSKAAPAFQNALRATEIVIREKRATPAIETSSRAGLAWFRPAGMSRAPAVVRIKRKRDAAAPDVLLLEYESTAKQDRLAAGLASVSLASGGAVQASAPTGTSTRKFRRLTTVEMDSYLRDASVAGGVLEQVAQRLRPKAASAPADPQPVSAEPRTGDASITPSPAVDSADGGDALLAAFPCVDVEMERVLGRAGPGAEAEGTAGSIPETHDMVYDIYCADSDEDGVDWEVPAGGAWVPVLSLGDDGEWVLEHVGAGADEEDVGAVDDEDSNAEDHWANDYPDEPGESDDSRGLDDEGSLDDRMGMRGGGHAGGRGSSWEEEGSDLSSGDGSESEFRFSRHGGLGGGGDSVEGGAAGRVLNATLTGFECGSNCELTAACFDSMRQ